MCKKAWRKRKHHKLLRENKKMMNSMVNKENKWKEDSFGLCTDDCYGDEESIDQSDIVEWDSEIWDHFMGLGSGGVLIRGTSDESMAYFLELMVFTMRSRNEREKGWRMEIHDLSGSVVAAAFITTPYVPSTGCDWVTKSNPGASLIVQLDERHHESWQPWGKGNAANP